MEEQKEYTEEEQSKLPVVRISVRSLVEFLLRSGDIDARRGAAREKDAMQMGSRLHRKIQGSMGSDYASEVALAGTYPCWLDEPHAADSDPDFLIRIEGRADGIFTENGTVYIDEIKGLLRSLDGLEEPYPVHLAQARCYAYLYGEAKEPEQIGVRMTYANLETEEKKYFTFLYTWEETKAWFLALVEEYKKWARFERRWAAVRTASIRRITFPYPYREGQDKLVRDVYLTISREKLLFLQAPTGVGKTLSTLFPAVKAMGEGKGEKVFFLTARTIGRRVAEETLELFRRQNLSFKSVTLTAKEKMCRCEEVTCNPDACPYAKGHFDRINDALYTLLQEQDRFTRESIGEAADRFMVCPFELSLDLAIWVDGIIADYNYVFHPRARLKRFFGEKKKQDYILLIDEAHNLVDRGRDMYSAALYKEDFLAVKKKLGSASPRLTKALERCNRRLLEMKRSCDGEQVLEGIGTLPITLTHLSGVMEDFLDGDIGSEAQRDAVRELYFAVGTFLETWDRTDEHDVIYDKIEDDGRFLLEIYCVDPSTRLQECLDKVRSAVFFSATLLPVTYYKQLLCAEEEPYAVYAESCFAHSNLLVTIGSEVSSRYTRRNPAEYRKIAEYIRQTVSARAGNYLVFFPSYRMLEEVQGCLEELLGDEIELLAQEAGLSEQEREDYLAAFQVGRARSLIGLCVMGSIFGEGIDLQGERLIGSIIVGTGIPQIGTKRRILKDYYDRKGMDGFAYAYQYPGMNKVLQAAGRVIRSHEDRGVVVLLDERFLSYSYRNMFPREWESAQIATRAQLPEILRRFWTAQPDMSF